MRRRPVLIGGLVALVVLVVGGIGVWLVFFSDDAPDEVDNSAANEQLDEDLAAGDEAIEPDAADATTAPDPVAPEEEAFDGDINRVWTVDNTIGSFEFDSASGSFAGFRVDEELTIGETTAVGRTDAVTGSITVADGMLTEAELAVDLTGIVSNDSRRENAIRNALDTDEFPQATFVLTQPVALPEEILDGEPVVVDAVGDLAIHGVTNQATFALTANVRDDGIAVVTGSTDIVFEDYGVTAPSAPIVVSVDDEGTVEVQLLLV